MPAVPLLQLFHLAAMCWEHSPRKSALPPGFSGTWYQSSSLFPPYTPDDTPEELKCGLHTFSSGKRIIMQSDDFIGATISGNAVISHNNSIVSFPTFFRDQFYYHWI
jgi:hypothetical protein